MADFVKIHTYLLCFNEEKIIDKVIEYYLGFSSKIFIFDNLSTDNSVEIAKEYPNVHVIPFDTNGKKNNAKHVQIKSQEYKKYSRKGGEYTEEVADWVICADMDELVYHPNLIDILKEYKAAGVTVPCLTGFNMIGVQDIDSNKPLITQYKNGIRHAVFDKRAIFNPDFDMSYSKGCHSEGAGFELMKETYGYKSSNKHPIALLHYKHIGSILYESAVKNYNRFNPEDIKKNSSGDYVGPGAHYKAFMEMGPGASPLLDRASPVLSEDMKVKFSDFPPSVGENSTKNSTVKSFDNSDVDMMRDAAIALEKHNLKLSYKLMKKANLLRPSGPIIRAKLEEYKRKLGM